MKLYKKILNQTWAQNIVSMLGAGYLRLVQITGRWEVRDWQTMQALIDENRPIILCFWHSRLIANAFGWKSDKPLHQLSTPHRDGKIAAATYNRLGVKTIWGSTSKGGSEAVRAMLKVLKHGGIISITPDGPRGPRQRMQKSAIDIARMSGAVLVPVSNSMSPFKMLGTWDRMIVPLPFAKGIFAVGQPVEVPRDASPEQLEEIRNTMEQTLNQMTQRLDKETGIITPEPAPLDKGTI
ncbi:MAG: lysophospholipid acyltransferase family protein [Rhodospirillaceae bacterium]|nr:lysophospholipid acyltransferase family protein [Rhodospirillaceae bacterium]